MVEVDYIGGLGNKLFQYCFGRILAEKLGYGLTADPIPGFPGTEEVVAGEDHSGHQEVILTGHVVDFQKVMSPERKRIILKGYFQRYEYYREYRDKIREHWLRFEALREPEIRKNDLLIYLRRSDSLIGKNGVPFSFFENLLKKEEFDRLYLSTDDPADPYVKNFRKYKPIVQSSSPMQDFKFITLFSKIVLSVGSFGWWAAFLSNAGKIYFPELREGLWSAERRDIDLRVGEKRYYLIECKEFYKPTLEEKAYIYLYVKFLRRVKKLWRFALRGMVERDQLKSY